MFLDTVMSAYRKSLAHTFLLHGVGVEDCITPGIMLGGFLRKALQQGKADVVVFYDAASGFNFPDDLAATIHKERISRGEIAPSDFIPMKTRAARALGWQPPSQDDKAKASPLAKALASAEMTFPTDPTDALPLIDKLLHATSSDNVGRVSPLKVTIVFEYAHVTFPRAQTPIPDFDVRAVFAAKWATESSWINGSFAPLILYITADKENLHPALVGENSRVYAVELPAPNYEERKSFVEQLLQAYDGIQLNDDLDDTLLATHTAGLSRLGIEDIIVNAFADGQAVSLEAVRERKRNLMASAYGGVLNTDSPRFGFDVVAGHAEVKAFCMNNIVEPLRSGNVRRVPRGCIFSGPPGTGKTMLAEALAYEAGVNFAKLSVQNLMDKFVGNSEKNLRRALDAIRSLVPCLVFLDELDTMFSTRDAADTNQVNKNLLGMILSFLSEPANKGKVVFIGATNRPDRIDAALRRPGRFDKMVPLLPPSHTTRVELLKIVAKGLGCAWSDDVDFDGAAQATESWTQAELEALVQAVFQEADDAGHGDTFTQDDLASAMSYTRPSTSQVEAWSRLAVQMCNDYRLLPEEWRQAAQAEELPDMLTQEVSTTRSSRNW